MNEKVFHLLEKKYKDYNTLDFIEHDPISIPHLFSKKQDIEIMAFFAAIFAWGQRKTIINKCKELIVLFEKEPYDFVTNFSSKDINAIQHFKHRTFNSVDLIYFLHFLQQHFKNYTSLESAFTINQKTTTINIEQSLINFNNYFFSLENFQNRTKKHVASPAQKSTCKRLNMFLRWMVRKDNKGVDFGIWKTISPANLYCPLDLHVDRIARHFGLITRQQNDWLTVVELTENLKQFDANDPVKYDFALFGIGVMEGVNI